MSKSNLTAACAAILLLASGAAVRPAAAAGDIEPSAGEVPAMVLAAKGVQIYRCQERPATLAAGYEWTFVSTAAASASRYEWTFVAPEAELFDRSGKTAGLHGAGPFWQSTDGSRIVGTVSKRADAPTAGAVAWLLLAAKSTGPEGSLSRVTSVQRLNTVGGTAPATGCDARTVGQTVRVDYTADYRFFTRN